MQWPDLFVYDAGGAELSFAEAKGPGDSLSPEQLASQRVATEALERLGALTGTTPISDLGPRPPVVMKVGGIEQLAAQVNNRGGASEHVILELSGSALDRGLVTVERVAAFSEFAGLTQDPPDAGQPLTWDFELPLGPATPSAGDVPLTLDPLFNAIQRARSATLSLAFHGTSPGKGELLLRVRGKSGPGKGRLRRITVEVAPSAPLAP